MGRRGEKYFIGGRNSKRLYKKMNVLATKAQGGDLQRKRRDRLSSLTAGKNLN